MSDVDAVTERAALLALLEERPPLPGEQRRSSWFEIALETSLRGSARSLWDETRALTLDGMTDSSGVLEAALDRLQRWAIADFDVLTVLDADYPSALRGVHDLPPILFTKGAVRRNDVAVSVVGSRRASSQGLDMAADVAAGLVERRLSVISGLADGIDTAAHSATLQAGGRPVGVIGTGITRVYPATAVSRALHEQVASSGALLSQFMPDAPPSRTSFPMRNATMSGLGIASVIVEAGEYSGTRVLARAALGHGRPVILSSAVVQATRWAQQLVGRAGVYVAENAPDVLTIVDRLVSESLRVDIAFPPNDVVVRLPDVR